MSFRQEFSNSGLGTASVICKVYQADFYTADVDSVTVITACMLSRSVMSDSFNPLDCNLPGSSVHRFFRQEYWSGLPFPSLRDRPDPGI